VSSLKNSVIIVNDNTDLVNLFTDVLEQQRFVTYGFTDPSLALKKIKSNPDQFSLMLTDYPTPRGSEKTIAKEVKATNKNIKVILTTGYDLSSVDISDEGYDKVITNPSEDFYIVINNQRNVTLNVTSYPMLARFFYFCGI
jgi:DNA-binding NtrC family response regulator